MNLTFGAATVTAAPSGPCVGAAIIGTCTSTPECQGDCEDAGGYEGICDQGGCCHCAI